MQSGFDIHEMMGLPEAEAARRLQQEGFNELPTSKKRSALAIAFEVVREPMFLLLVACGLVYCSWHASTWAMRSCC